MITKFNNKTSPEMQEKYLRLFDRAYNDLKEYDEKHPGEDPLLAPGETIFTDLGHYYSHMADFLTINKPIYIMVPLDEDCFDINTNTREIIVPPSFKKCGGVTNDDKCEIITFKVDRYFDFTDLGGPDCSIIVQWKNAAGKEGYTSIALVEDNTFFEDGKLRFGWPITKEITEVEGDVQFSVQFYKGTIGNKTVVLNTLPAILPIRKGLIVDPFSTPVDGGAILFENVVVNSINTATTYPTEVKFLGYNPNPTTQANLIKIKPDDTLELAVLADTVDRNELVYEWFRSRPVDPSDLSKGYVSTPYSEWDNKNLFDTKFEYKIYTPQESEIFLNKSFYKDNGHGGYERYTGSDWPDFDLYQRYNILKFKADSNTPKSDITGIYYATAYNRKYESDGITVKGQMSKDSSHFQLFKPDAIVYETKPGTHAFIDTTPKKPELIVSFKSSKKNPTITNNWSAKDAEGNSLVKDTDFTVTSYSNNGYEYTVCDVKTPGYYTLNTISELNRFGSQTQDNPANYFECKVTNHPEGPTLQPSTFGYTANKPTNYGTWIDNPNSVSGTTSGSWSDDDINTFAIGTEEDLGTQYVFLKVDHNSLNKLESDSLTYEWFYTTESDGYTNPHYINVTDIGEKGIVPQDFTLNNENNFIVLRVTWDDNTSRRFQCKITNTLGGETAVVNSQPIDIVNRAMIVY